MAFCYLLGGERAQYGYKSTHYGCDLSVVLHTYRRYATADDNGYTPAIPGHQGSYASVGSEG
jgi:hypothetical protein